MKTLPLPLHPALFLLVLGSICAPPLAVSAKVRLPGFYSDHMVFQQQAPIPIRGWADPNETVTVQLGDDAATAVSTAAGADGCWRVELPSREATGDPLTLTVSSGANPQQTITLKDILVGEVWLCSGQSNMAWTVNASLNPKEEIAAANHPAIRQMKIAQITSGTPADDVSSTWQICSPETAGGFTAAGYFMARELHAKLGVPIGLLNISWGGTRIEPWTPIEGFEAIASLADIHRQVSLTLPASPLYKAALKQHIDAIDQWLATARTALEKSDAAPVTPDFPGSLKPLTAHTAPTAIFNAMMHPVVGYGMRGAIWYQGESNHQEGMLYLDKKKAMLAGWRKLWGIGEFPFYFVQIAPFQYGQEDPSILPKFWEAQTACLEIPNTGMAVINDIGNLKDIHPRNKQEVGRRLALLALKHTYGKKNLVASGPVLDSMTVDSASLKLKFTETADGLKSRDDKALSHFEIIGEQAEFVPARAVIEGKDMIILSAPEVKEPAAMRFAWHKLAEPNLVNSAGLPAGSFRAGEIPEYDFLSLKVPEAVDYELVYDLDLKKLGPEIKYQADRSGELAGPFKRIGYFIELQKNDGSLQWAWTAMDAFTDDLTKIGIPTVASGAHFQTAVKNLNVLTNVEALPAANTVSGNIEFWPNNYGPANSAQVPGASPQIYDFGDQPSDPVLGYGSMQVHQTAAKKTVFAINHWRAGANADLGIGNGKGQKRGNDWTFFNNANQYESARLRVLIRRETDATK